MKLYLLQADIPNGETFTHPAAYTSRTLALSDKDVFLAALTKEDAIFATIDPKAIKFVATPIPVKLDTSTSADPSKFVSSETLIFDAEQVTFMKRVLLDEQERLRKAIWEGNDEVKNTYALCLQVRKELGEPV